MKKLISIMLILTLIVSFSVFAQGAQEKETEVTDGGKVLTIYCWNDEFQTRFNDYYAEKLPSDVKVNWVITPNADNAYQNKLDEVLREQKTLSPDNKVDIFLVEADYALKYVDTPYTLDVKKDLGLTDDDLSEQYKYTQDIMTDSNGALKGTSWQACPGAYIYRRSIAEKVLGTSDPDEVQKQIDSWDKFDAVAKKMKDQGYFMLSGFDDAYRVFSDNVTSPWVIGNKINIDPSIEQWIEQTKNYTVNGYNNKANLWSAESWSGATKEGKVFGYFGPSWFQDFCLAPATLDNPDGQLAVGNGSYGDWAICKGPKGFSWGGTWICGAAGSDNYSLIKDVMYTLTCDEDILIKIAKDKGDFTNNEGAMRKIAESDFQNEFLGGQNHIAVLLDSAKSIDRSNISPYDQGMTEKLMAAFADYYNGTVTKAQAWENFYTAIIELYPNLER